MLKRRIAHEGQLNLISDFPQSIVVSSEIVARAVRPRPP